MRDHMKDEDYFKDYIKQHHSAIVEFEDLAEQLMNERGADDRGVRSAYISLSGYYFNKAISLYSAGHSMDEIKDILPPLIDSMEKTWDPGVIKDYYYYLETVWLLAIGIMLEIEDTLFARLEKLSNVYEEHDALVDFLLNSRCSGWEPHHSTFLFGLPYKKLLPVIHGDDSEQQTQKLKSYLKNDWYKGHKKAWWYETHHDDDIIYPGYWSFESGAIVKILGLDDSFLKDVPHYPYDMVHYKD